MIVRPRTPADMSGCASALREVHESDAYPSVWPDDPEAWLDPSGVVGAWVADSGDRVVGHVAVVEKADGLWVSRLFVSPVARGQRAGEALLAEAHAHAATRPLLLDVIDQSADAIALYERTGWTLVGRRAADWVMADGTRPISRVYSAPI